MTGSASRDRLPAAAAGVAAALLGIGAGELAATLLAPSSSPFAVVGGFLIDGAPAWAKDTAIAWFGTGDKAALLTGIALVLLAAAGALGLLQRRFRGVGVAGFLVLGAAVAVLAPLRADAAPLSWLPAPVAGIVAALVVRALVRRLPDRETETASRDRATEPLSRDAGSVSRSTAPPPAAPRSTTPRPTDPAADGPTRRRFLAWTAGAAAVGVLATVAATAGRAGSVAVTAVRTALRLPKPAVAAAPIPAGAALKVDGISPLITPNADFYRIDTALVVPQVDPAQWRLRIHGLVAHEVTLTWDELLALPLVEAAATLSCVSNDVGGDLIGNAVWLGYPIRELLAKAQPAAAADMVLSTSVDGFTAGTPIEALTDDRNALLAIGMNGRPLPIEHGFPVRMVVPGLYGYVSATKWVTDLEVTRFDRATAYWTARGWSARGPVKLESRIDVPKSGRALRAGDTVIAGVAWQPHAGVSVVEVQIDDGPWQRAELAPAISADTWVQWRLPWAATAGQHTLRCRATGADGTVQTADVAPPAPDGATGWHTIDVSVNA
ncbi:molybdopterin-dependent oxidoreductase [Microbacterium sp.]|uniref:molybdopterin-dependent oxidoreductase n=1 Tax=Microbacterium sp. TaxID=51671 RepID=UPI001AC7D860|nr:molybdopterin-dependent oxidoreductase [Microbacterium sp.]MBN9158838.1 molybdopterin-dependent oxidoreductase [Microbacterium sp.]MBS1901928.1 molybdopterin-dependent oxidoreductase [Actinomycetota bacterium]